MYSIQTVGEQARMSRNIKSNQVGNRPGADIVNPTRLRTDLEQTFSIPEGLRTDLEKIYSIHPGGEQT